MDRTFNLEIDDRMKTLINHGDFEQCVAGACLTTRYKERGLGCRGVEIRRCEVQ